MNKIINKQTIQSCKLQLIYLRNGIAKIIRKPWILISIIMYLYISNYLFRQIPSIPNMDSWLMTKLNTVLNGIAIVLVTIGLLLLISIIGKPLGVKKAKVNLRMIGLTNYFGESPLLIDKRKFKNSSIVTEYKFLSNGLSLDDFESRSSRIESALNINIIEIKYGKSKREILIFAISGKNQKQKLLPWKREYLIYDDFTLVLGESHLEKIKINLSVIPHILLGGSSGSGKSVLLKLLLEQCFQKNAEIYLIDFKGGVDFSKNWQDKCKMVFDENSFLNLLETIIVKLDERKLEFSEMSTPNISKYNQLGNNLKRIIIACDEIAEILDTKGKTKEQNELIGKIENHLSTIARQGRAFGIHLIIATQRPDANILTGQIKNNINYKVCGRADDVLSSIILDSTIASKVIPNDSQGLFINQDETMFQAYWYTDE